MNPNTEVALNRQRAELARLMEEKARAAEDLAPTPELTADVLKGVVAAFLRAAELIRTHRSC